MMQFMTGFPGVCHAPPRLFARGHSTTQWWRAWVPWVAVGIVTLITLVHLFGIRLVSLVNDAGVVAEIAAVVAITATLLAVHFWFGQRDLAFLLDRTSPVDGQPAGIPAFALSLLMERGA